MAKIAYNGMELEDLQTACVADLPKKMIVWGNIGNKDDACIRVVTAIALDNNGTCYAIARQLVGSGVCIWDHFAEIPEKSAPRMATNRELAKWLAQGNGEWCNCIGDSSRAAIEWWYDQGHSETKANNVFVRKWDDTEWHLPDVEYMGIAEVKTYEGIVKREG